MRNLLTKLALLAFLLSLGTAKGAEAPLALATLQARLAFLDDSEGRFALPVDTISGFPVARAAVLWASGSGENSWLGTGAGFGRFGIGRRKGARRL
jgi:hypothetical protein